MLVDSHHHSWVSIYSLGVSNGGTGCRWCVKTGAAVDTANQQHVQKKHRRENDD